MLCRDDARRVSKVDEAAIKESYEALMVLYCAKCASKHNLPISHRVIVEQEVRSCMICGGTEIMSGSLMRDNTLLTNVSTACTAEERS